MTPRVAVAGPPNAGKSTLINRLCGVREAVTHADRGVTRDWRPIPCEWNGLAFELIDTGGIDRSDSEPLSEQIREQARAAIAAADVILAVVDVNAGLGPAETELAEELRPLGKRTLLAVNKVDSDAAEHLAAELHGLGLGEPFPVSAAQGRGTGDLLDAVVDALREREEQGDERGPIDEEDEFGPPRIALLGRPNVGKSSLLNRILGTNRVIVSDLAGTTRDPVDTEVAFEGEPIVLVDTAGLRRPSKAGGDVGRFSQMRTERAAEAADAAIVVCDASEGLTSEDLRITELAMRFDCATVLAMNKWDETRCDLDDVTARAARKIRMRPPVRACSAETGRGVQKVVADAVRLAHKSAERVRTSDLNRLVTDVAAKHPPPSRRGRRLKLLYAAQVGRRPPRIAIQVNDRSLVVRDWAYHLENSVREAYGLEGVPLVIDYVGRQEQRPRGARR